MATEVRDAPSRVRVKIGCRGLRIIDVSNPATPVELGALLTGPYSQDVEIVGTLA